MPARAKFTRRRERRLLALIEGGATVAEASRAVQLSRMTIHRHAQSDATFALLLALARGAPPAPGEGWRDSAAMLEALDPARYGSPELPDDFDFDPLGA